jgi:hypothetical protein
MSHIPATLQYLLMSWGAVTAVLMILVIYGDTLSVREDGQLFLTKEEESHDGLRPAAIDGENASLGPSHRRRSEENVQYCTETIVPAGYHTKSI